VASLNVAGFREHVTSALGDTPLELLLDAAWQAIAEVIGIEGDVTEVRDGGGSFIFLPRPAATITSVKEWLGYSSERTLDEDDYRLLSDGVSLKRLTTGTTPATYWAGPVEVALTPVDDESARQVVQIALVKLFLDHHPGIQEEEIGDWRQVFQSNSVWNYAQERESILDTLRARWLEFA
jgi:hypothetical protein